MRIYIPIQDTRKCLYRHLMFNGAAAVDKILILLLLSNEIVAESFITKCLRAVNSSKKGDMNQFVFFQFKQNERTNSMKDICC